MDDRKNEDVELVWSIWAFSLPHLGGRNDCQTTLSLNIHVIGPEVLILVGVIIEFSIAFCFITMILSVGPVPRDGSREDVSGPVPPVEPPLSSH